MTTGLAYGLSVRLTGMSYGFSYLAVVTQKLKSKTAPRSARLFCYVVWLVSGIALSFGSAVHLATPGAGFGSALFDELLEPLEISLDSTIH